MKNADLLSELFDKKVLDVLMIFFKNRDKNFYMREVAKQSKVPLASTFRIINKLTLMGFIEQFMVSRFKVYRLAATDKARDLEILLIGRKTPLDFFIEELSKLSEVRSVVLHGEATREGANILIIGENVDSNRVKEIIGLIREKYQFNITPLTLTQEQFDQMDAMGLYPKRKKIIFNR